MNVVAYLLTLMNIQVSRSVKTLVKTNKSNQLVN